MSRKIQDNNLLYNILCPLVQFGTRCHYHHFTVRGIDNLPADGAYIRQLSTENNVTIFTSLDTVSVLLDVLEETTLTISTIDA